MEIKNPIFFIGMPRSGTSIIFEAFAAHKDLGWLSNYSNRMPAFPYINLIHRMFFCAQGRKNQYQKIPIYKRILPEPQEVYNVWNRFFGQKFAETFLANCSPSEDEIEKCRKYIKHILWAENKSRFCAKFTGPPRIRFLSRIFPDAYFIDVVRDPRATVSSLLLLDWWKKRGLTKPFWEGALKSSDLEIWEDTGCSPVALAALQWCSVYEATVDEISGLDNKYYRVKYEEFMTSPLATIEQLVSYCGISKCEKMKNYVSSQSYKNMNYKYNENLPIKDIKLIEYIAGKHMKKLGYLN